MLWSSLRFLGQTSLYIATTCTMWPTTTWILSQTFYYLHITTTVQNTYPRSHNKFPRYFHFKVIYMLFYHNIVFFFEQKYMLIYICQYRVIRWKIMLPLYNHQISLLTILLLYKGLLYNDHLSIMTTEIWSSKWSLYTGLTV